MPSPAVVVGGVLFVVGMLLLAWAGVRLGASLAPFPALRTDEHVKTAWPLLTGHDLRLGEWVIRCVFAAALLVKEECRHPREVKSPWLRAWTSDGRVRSATRWTLGVIAPAAKSARCVGRGRLVCVDPAAFPFCRLTRSG